jgi:hypothetical protein
MPYVNFKEIDGFKVVCSFQDMGDIDPVATAKAIAPLLAETEEHKHLESLGQQFGELERRRQGILGASRRARNHGELKAAKDAYEAVVKEQQDIQRQAAEYKPKHLAKRRALMETHGVYFEIPGCQEIDQETKDKLTDAFALLQPGQVLTVEGHIVTDEARKVARIARLDDDEKEKEKQRSIRDALATAARMRSRYEIEGREDPLADSKQWFEKEKARLENLYK